MAGNKKQSSDFDPEDLVKNEKHEKDISALSTRIENLEKKFGTNESLANTIVEASKSQKQIDEMLAENIVLLIQKNEVVRTEIKNQLDTIDRSTVNKIIKGWGGKAIVAIWSLIVLVIGAVVNSHFSK